jgi:hypothetical protein
MSFVGRGEEIQLRSGSGNRLTIFNFNENGVGLAYTGIEMAQRRTQIMPVFPGLCA